MLRNAFLIALTTVIAVAGGAGSVAYVLASGYSAGAVKVGPWTTFPDFGTRDAGPYARAEVAKNGILALGRAEGVSFVADTDSNGRPLGATCSYRIAGLPPPGRFWTIWTTEKDAPATTHRPALNSQGLLRERDGSVKIIVGRSPAPGNWLPVTSSGRLHIMLTVYDASSIAGAVSSDIAMPNIELVNCDE